MPLRGGMGDGQFGGHMQRGEQLVWAVTLGRFEVFARGELVEAYVKENRLHEAREQFDACYSVARAMTPKLGTAEVERQPLCPSWAIVRVEALQTIASTFMLAAVDQHPFVAADYTYLRRHGLEYAERAQRQLVALRAQQKSQHYLWFEDTLSSPQEWELWLQGRTVSECVPWPLWRTAPALWPCRWRIST